MSVLTCDIVTEFQDLVKLSQEWERLFLEDVRLDVFQKFDWAKVWWNSFGEAYKLCTAVIREEGRVIGILPLVMGGRCVRFLGHSASDYNSLLCEPNRESDVVSAALRGLLRWQGGWDQLLLENVPEHSRLAEALGGISDELHHRISVRRGDPCPILILGEQRQEVLSAVMGKEKLRKMVRHLARHGELRFRHLEDWEETCRHFSTFVQYHVQRSALARRRSSFLKPDVLGFYKAMLAESRLRSEIRFSILTVADKPVAYHFGFFCKRKYLYYKPTFDVDWWELSPGHVLLSCLFDYCRGADVVEFDFGWGGESYKDRFSNQVRHNLHIEMFRPGVRPAILHTRQRIVHKAKAWITAVPAVYRLVQRAVTAAEIAGRAGVLKKLAGLVFRREEVLLVWRELADTMPAISTVSDGLESVRLEPLTLAKLAELSCTFPEKITFERLSEARERLKNRESINLVSDGGCPRAILWTCVSNGIPLPDGGAAWPSGRGVFLGLSWWSLSTQRAHDWVPSVLRWLAYEAYKRGLDCGALLPRHLEPSSNSIQCCCFKPELRLIVNWWFGNPQWKRKKLDLFHCGG